MKLKALFLSVCLTLTTLQLLAQHESNILQDSLFETSPAKSHWDFSFSLKTQNYFRGLLSSQSPTIAITSGYVHKNWILGMYGGVAFDGSYQETDFFVIYNLPKVDFHLEYYYNFSPGITDIPEPSGLFDFDRKTTRGLLDLIIDVQLGKKENWDLRSSTFLFGRDTYMVPSDEDETILIRGDQRYSQYVELGHSWKWHKTKVRAHAGGAFGWADFREDNFYGEEAGITNLGISLTRKFIINNKLQVPVKVSSYLNPMAETAYLNVSLNLIQLSKL